VCVGVKREEESKVPPGSVCATTVPPCVCIACDHCTLTYSYVNNTPLVFPLVYPLAYAGLLFCAQIWIIRNMYDAKRVPKVRGRERVSGYCVQEYCV
jgi:hypothetical protein